MRKRFILAAGVIALVLLLGLLVWQGSFSLGPFAPSSAGQTYAFWAISTLIFILIVTLGFMLVRTGVKLYIERQTKRPGAQIRWKLVAGAVGLSFVPVVFLVLFSIYVLNRTLDKWFSRPAENMQQSLIDVGSALDREMQDKLTAQSHWLASLPPDSPAAVFEKLCRDNNIHRAVWQNENQTRVLCDNTTLPVTAGDLYSTTVTLTGGTLTLTAPMPVNLARKQDEIDRAVNEYWLLAAHRKEVRQVYLLLLSLITLFVLFFATWIALVLARLISGPITALLNAAQEVRRGNLGYRVQISATDELGTLVKAFNEMTEALETNSRELESRRRFTEAILESIPTGVVSLSADGHFQRVNRALSGIFPEDRLARAARVEDLFSGEDATEIRYLMNRARRTGVAGGQIELKLGRRTLHLSVTVAALDQRRSSGFVLVIEDTSELLRAQKAMAWHEVARRVAHEIKNPLTPIALCSDRISRQLNRLNGAAADADTQRILRECSATIAREVESVRALVDEFSEYARFPAAQPVLSDLNEVVDQALAVFAGRLEGIEVRKELAGVLPPVSIDREQFKRVIVNLVDNAAEAMQNSPVRRLYIGTSVNDDDSVELVVADTGCGISPEDKEKLFLPYFSTKGRGTGLGLAIISHILTDHGAAIRVEDNSPSGARFIIEIAPMAEAEAKIAPAEARV
ncbi:MAG: sensor histidine kinase [Bryobacteraceae bacterium]